jgi:hypothetical protein
LPVIAKSASDAATPIEVSNWREIASVSAERPAIAKTSAVEHSPQLYRQILHRERLPQETPADHLIRRMPQAPPSNRG